MTTDVWLQFVSSNTVIAVPLALCAYVIQRRGRRPFLAHLLWLVVLIKLVTPPLVSIPLLPASAPSADVVSAAAAIAGGASFDASGAAHQTLDGLFIGPLSIGSGLLVGWPSIAVGLWAIGSLAVLVLSLLRIVRFDRLLRITSVPAEPALVTDTARIAARLGLKRLPEVRITSAAISPLVWWIGGRVGVYLPRNIADALSRPDRYAILAHELGHLRRRDHLVRWLECLVGVVLWWHPLAWWARRNLRICEEICCDAFVLARLRISHKTYAGALVSALGLLASPRARASGMASTVFGLGTTERRLQMILSPKSIVDSPRPLRVGLLVLATLVAPLGIGLAQETDPLVRAEQWLESGVNSAFLTRDQADVMLTALKAQTERDHVTPLGDGGVALFPAPEVRALSEKLTHVRAEIAVIRRQVETGEISAGEGDQKLATINAQRAELEAEITQRKRAASDAADKAPSEAARRAAENEAAAARRAGQ